MSQKFLLYIACFIFIAHYQMLKYNIILTIEWIYGKYHSNVLYIVKDMWTPDHHTH